MAPEVVLSAAVEWAREIAGSSAFALAQTKKLMRLASTSTFEDIFTAKAEIQEECGKSEYFVEARRKLCDKSAKE